VGNGRDKEFFKPNVIQRDIFRKKLGLSPEQILLVYCGSLGPQYGLDSMLTILKTLLLAQPNSRLLLLTPGNAYLENRIPKRLLQKVTVIQGSYPAIPFWLNAADLALAIREPTFSMQGVAPIKLGEYLLMGLPTIASRGIGDTEELLGNKTFVHLFDHKRKGEMQIVMNWLKCQDFLDKQSIRGFALQHFSLEKSIGDYKTALDSMIGLE
jgi:glycosyltransferase involved in cell wall biosynthesis